MKIIAIAVQSIDGFIARNSKEFISWSSKEDKQFFAKVTKESGVVVMGRGTFELFPKPLKDRLNVVLTSDPSKYESIPGLVEYTNDDLETLVKKLGDRGFSTICITGGSRTYTEFLKMKLLDEVYLTIEPVFLGRGISLFTESVDGVKAALMETKLLNSQSVLLQYRLSYE